MSQLVPQAALITFKVQQIGQRLPIESDQRIAAAADVSDTTGWMANDQSEVGDRFRHQGSHTDHSEAANYEVATYRTGRADGCSLPHERRQRTFVGSGRSQASQIGGCGARMAVISEGDTRTYHNAILNCYGIANVDECVDFDPMSDLHIVGNVSLFTDDTLLPDTSRAANVDVVPYGSSRAKLHVFFDDGRGMNLHGDIGNALRRHAEASCASPGSTSGVAQGPYTKPTDSS